MEISKDSWDAFNAYKSGPRSSDDFKAIVTNPASSPEDREKAKAALTEYAASVKWVTTRGETEPVVVGMFARSRASCIWLGLTPQPLPKEEDDNA
ncbi:MAG TPA: hypothetical protein VGG14_16615 [Candidatus Sulfotelmatobacter sp.]|jgi:hypothetical protein